MQVAASDFWLVCGCVGWAPRTGRDGVEQNENDFVNLKELGSYLKKSEYC